MDTEIAVTGVGMVTAAGLNAQATWQGLLEGRCLAAPDRRLTGLPVDFACAVRDFDAASCLGRRLSWRIDRFIQLGMVAAREAVADARLFPDSWQGARVAVVLGNSNGGNDQAPQEYGKLNSGNYGKISPVSLTRGLCNMLAGEISTDLKALGPSFVVSTACASGASAIGVARHLLRAGACDIAITGGSDSTCSPFTAVAFHQISALSTRADDPARSSRPFDASRDGFVLAEGAGVLVLERSADARVRSAPIRAVVAGYGATADAHHHTSPHPHGHGAIRAMHAALDDAGMSPEDVDHINAHGTSTKVNDLVEAQALNAVFGTRPPVTAIKSVIGHSAGAAGAIEAIVTVLSLQQQIIPPTANVDRLAPDIALDLVTKLPRKMSMSAAISNSFAFGGQNAALLFRTP